MSCVEPSMTQPSHWLSGWWTTRKSRTLEEWKEEQRRGPGGRPELFSKRVLLVALTICALTNQELLLETVCDVIFRQLNERWRAELGIPDPPADGDRNGWRACYRNVRTRFHGIRDLMDPSPLPKNRRLDDDTFSALSASNQLMRSEAGWKQLEQRLEWFANQVLEASIGVMPREYRQRWKGSMGVDATFVPSYARPHKNAEQAARKGSKSQVVTHSADPDAGGYRRDPDDRDGDASAGVVKVGYGYENTIAVSGSDGPDRDSYFPSLAMGMAILHRPGHDVGRNGIRALASVRSRGHPANWLAADRAYSSAKSEDFQLPARAIGYRAVFDYKVDQLGVRANWQGFLQIEGNWYCPMIPKPLIDATADRRAKKTDPRHIDKATYDRRIAERRQYRARLKEQPDSEGYERLQCPAAGPSPLVRCELKPRSISRKTQGKLRIMPNESFRSLPPPCCTQQSITIPPDAGAKFAQELAYGSPEWKATYNKVRNANEGYNGYVKDDESLDLPRRRRVHGVAAQTVFAAFLHLAANIRKIRAFLERIAEEAGKLRRLPRRRKTKPLSDWSPDVHSVAPGSDPDPPSSA